MSKDPASIEAAIRAVLESQQTAWNEGNVPAFMEHYWKSDDLTFSAGGKVTRTWQGTLENYQQRYPTPHDMGKLAFDNLEVTPLGTQAALVLGDWQLARASGQLGGNFTLIFRRVDDRWVIIHDHTSRADAD
jgi:beta-aspartyl-peptidase (threonine type)